MSSSDSIPVLSQLLLRLPRTSAYQDKDPADPNLPEPALRSAKSGDGNGMLMHAPHAGVDNVDPHLAHPLHTSVTHRSSGQNDIELEQ